MTEAVITHEPSAETPITEARSWYGTSFSFSHWYTIQSNSFDGNNVGIEMNCSSKGSGYFTVYLYRGGSVIGSAQFKLNGFTKAVWTNVGPGSYSFRLYKKADGASVKCSNVAMYSW